MTKNIPEKTIAIRESAKILIHKEIRKKNGNNKEEG